MTRRSSVPKMSAEQKRREATMRAFDRERYRTDTNRGIAGVFARLRGERAGAGDPISARGVKDWEQYYRIRKHQEQGRRHERSEQLLGMRKYGRGEY